MKPFMYRTFYLPRNLIRELDKYCKKHEIGKSHVVQSALTQWLNGNKKELEVR